MVEDNSKLERFVVFQLAEHHLALSMDYVLRVVEYSPPRCEKLNASGLIQIGRHTVRILDLQQQLSCEKRPQLSGNSLFLVITHSPQGQLYGIPVDSPPDFIEISLKLMQLLPRSGHHPNILRIASHAAVIVQDGVSITVFLLDTKQVESLVE